MINVIKITSNKISLALYIHIYIYIIYYILFIIIITNIYYIVFLLSRIYPESIFSVIKRCKKSVINYYTQVYIHKLFLIKQHILCHISNAHMLSQETT